MSDKQEEPETPGVLDPNVDAGLTREALYELVWSEPMLKVAAQFGVSSSYMARVCTLLRNEGSADTPHTSISYNRLYLASCMTFAIAE